MERGLPRQTEREKHHAALPYAKVPAVVAKLSSSDQGLLARLAFEFLFLTAARTGEVLGARWSEIDETQALWTIPAERMKAAREHRVPLGTRAMSILREAEPFAAGSAYLFPGRSTAKPMSNMIFLMALRQMNLRSKTRSRPHIVAVISSRNEESLSSNGATMLNKWEAAGQLAEQRLPLYTSEIRQCLRKTHEGINAPAPAFSAVLELVKLHPDHFGDLMPRKTKGHSIKGKCVWTSPDTDYEFHDVDIEVVLKYLRVCLYIQSRFARMPHDDFVHVYSAFHSKKKADLIERGMRRDQDMFFNQSPALMDDTRWDNWLRLARWTEDEAVALSLDKDPDVVSSENIQNKRRVNDLPSPFLEEYQQRMRQLKRAIDDCEELTPLRPASFMSWAVGAYKDVPARFIEITSDDVRRGNPKNGDAQNTRDQDIDVDKMNAKSRRTLRLMLLCMAIDKYGHNPDALKSPATKAIVDAFYDVGLTIDAGTVKDALSDAAKDVNLQTDVATIREAMKRS